jgi:hypothetical protein
MIPHEKESPDFTYDLATERQALRGNKTRRHIPDKAPCRLLAATWNLTNFGVQLRTDDDLADKRSRSTGGVMGNWAFWLGGVWGGENKARFLIHLVAFFLKSIRLYNNQYDTL